MQTDSELLRHYVETGAEDAFAELVQRYAELVYSVALRLTNGDVHLAEDVTQEVFIRLIHKAPALIRHEALAGWLHTTARYVAFRTTRGRRRREFREQEAVAMHTNPEPKTNWDELSPLLDEAVGQLNDRDRQAVLLRYFQGWSHREVGAALGVNEDAARVRTDRAVEKLRNYFVRSGVATSSILLAEALSTNSASAAPVGLVGKVQAASLASANKLGLGHAVRKVFFMKTKLILNTTIALLAVGSVTIWLTNQSSASTPNSAPSVIAQAPNASLPTTQVEMPSAKPVVVKTVNDQAAMAALTDTQKKDVAELNTLLSKLANATRTQQPIVDCYAPKQLANRGITPEYIAEIQASYARPAEPEPATNEGKPQTSEEVMLAKFVANMRQVNVSMFKAFALSYEAMETQIPKFNAAGDEATYEKIEASDDDIKSGTFLGGGDHTLLHFIKSGGKWYINEDPGFSLNPDGDAVTDPVEYKPDPSGRPDPFAPVSP